jgi:hypothetical protein
MTRGWRTSAGRFTHVFKHDVPLVRASLSIRPASTPEGPLAPLAAGPADGARPSLFSGGSSLSSLPAGDPWSGFTCPLKPRRPPEASSSRRDVTSGSRRQSCRSFCGRSTSKRELKLPLSREPGTKVRPRERVGAVLFSGGPDAGECRQSGANVSENIYAKVSALTAMGAIVSGVRSGGEECPACKHPWQEHDLCASARPPTEGWIECPVPGCGCHQTWSLPADVAEQVRQHYVAEE